MADKISRRSLIAAAGAAGAGVAIAATIGALNRRPEAKAADRIVAKRQDGALPIDDPLDEGWFDADPVLVSVAPQQVVQPFLEEAGVSELTVEALHNGQELGLRLGWNDPDADDLNGIYIFHDAVAIQLPALAGAQPPPITMGAPGAPVHILQWRASWQRDLAGRTGVEDLYPNVVRDETPDRVLPGGTAQLFYVGRVVGNPLSVEQRTTSVEEVVAEGFGTATTLSEQRARGGGIHEAGRWAVTIGFPMERAPAGDPLQPGSTWPVAFAVWMGSMKNRDSRKHYANWLDLELET
jgi:hypothetical protein